MSGTCTTLDHIYPSTVPGTPCYCGAKTWGGVPRSVATKKLASGAAVRIRATGEETTVVEMTRDCGDVVYRVDRTTGRRLFDRDELEAL